MVPALPTSWEIWRLKLNEMINGKVLQNTGKSYIGIEEPFLITTWERQNLL